MLRGLAGRNLRLKVLALALAAVMWTGVAYASNPPDTRVVSIHVPQASADVAPFTLVHPIADLVIRVSGTRQHLDEFVPADLVVTVSYRGVRSAGVQSVPVSIVNNDRDVALDSPPTSVTAELDRIDSKTVGVTVDVTNQPPQGYVVVSSSTSPSAVTVIGPAHQLGTVEARVSINLTNQKTNFQADEPVSLIDANGQPIGSFGVSIAGHPQGGVLVTITIAPSLTSRASAVLPKVSGSLPPGHYLGGLSVNPATVVLAGPQDLLNTLDSVAAQTISLAGLTGTESLSLRVLPPPGVTASPATVTVTVVVIAVPQPTATPTPTPTPAPTP